MKMRINPSSGKPLRAVLLGCCAAALALLAVALAESSGGRRSKQQATPLWSAPNKLSSSQAIARLAAENDPIWRAARREVERSLTDIVAQDTSEKVRGIRYSKLMCNPAGGNTIALTFDDGPHPATTQQILQILRRYGVKASFFLVGTQVEKFPNLARAEMGAGHTVGNHTFHHVCLTKIPSEYVADEIKACGDVLRNVTGIAPRFFRPPGGDYNPMVANIANRLGYTIALWTDNSGDSTSPPKDKLLDKALRRATPGGIILMHDGIKQTVEVLPELIETLKQRGYTFVTLDQMAPRSRSRS
jgi:peptidoglycan/xylan/chitin deacetylase (PgdA/CDA1 family)